MLWRTLQKDGDECYHEIEVAVASFLVSLQFKRFHLEVITELEKKTEMDVKYMNVREFV